MNLKKLFFLFSFFLLISCGTLQQGGYIIDDFLIVPTEATNNIGTKNLNVFVFENDLTTPPIELFLAEKYKLETYQTREFWVEDNKERFRSEEHTSELQSRPHLVCRLLLEK